MTNRDQPRTILAAIDFSETGDGAARWAAEIAAAHGAGLVLFHALAPAMPADPAPEFLPLPARFYDDLSDAARAHLARLAAELGPRVPRIETATEIGPAAATIVAAARRRGADLVVAGTRGLTGWKKMLLGSTAAHVVRGADCPVLVVHPEDAGKPRRPRTVVVPTDFSQDATLAVDAAIRLLGRGSDERIVLVHAFHVPIEFVAPLPAPVLVEDRAQAHTAARIEAEKVATRIREAGLGVETRVVEGYPPEEIVRAAEETGADLVAMGTHGRSGLKRLVLGSTAERVVPAAPCPVLTVHR
ncbi:universal stress protein [bacterium]|nr:universal stress protein [bacterium]